MEHLGLGITSKSNKTKRKTEKTWKIHRGRHFHSLGLKLVVAKISPLYLCVILYIYLKVYVGFSKKYVIFEVQKCQFSKLGANMQNPIFSKLYILKCQKKSVPTIFFKSIFFMGTSIGLNLLTFFNFFAFKKKKFHFTSENRARTAKLSVPMD